MDKALLKIGTRGSPLALKQVDLFEAALKAAHPDVAVERVIMKTSGDWKPADGETRLSEKEGGKGLFVREIEQALADGAIDCAVHSAKDVPSFLDDAFALDHVLSRANPYDAFICHEYGSFDELPEGAVVGTSSLRRQAFLLAIRPDLNIVPLRGNVQTRLEKIESGLAQATFLAMAGLERLGLADAGFVHPLGADILLPASGQGVIAIETRRDDLNSRALLDAVHHKETGFCLAAERAALQTLDGTCHTPIGAYAVLDASGLTMELRLAIAYEDGRAIYRETAKRAIHSIKEAESFGHELASLLKERSPSDILA
ncbi:MAG: hydroxymethylbilane synthase [Micavibrio sp.]